jgi:hypothetical protein
LNHFFSDAISLTIGMSMAMLCLGCAQPEQGIPNDDSWRFEYGLNEGDHYFPAYLYEHVDTVARHLFQAKANEATLRKDREPSLCSEYSNKDVIRVVYTSAFDFHHHLVVSLVKLRRSVRTEIRPATKYKQVI